MRAFWMKIRNLRRDNGPGGAMRAFWMKIRNFRRDARPCRAVRAVDLRNPLVSYPSKLGNDTKKMLRN